MSPKVKSYQPYQQLTSHRPAHPPSYGEVGMISPDVHLRHTLYMPVFSQDDEVEVEIQQPHIGAGDHLSARHSGVSEEDFYVGAQYSQPSRLYPSDMYGFPQLSQ
jgi:hypothetical protein